MGKDRASKAGAADLRRQVEQLTSQCRRNEQFLRIMDIVQAGVVIHRHDTSITYANPAARVFLGLSEDQLTGRMAFDPCWHFCQPDGAKLAVEDYPVNQVVSSRSSVLDMVVGINRPDIDKVVWVLVNALPLFQDDALSDILVTFVDITKVKTASEALRHSQVSMHAIIDKTPLGVCVTDENGFFESVNEAYCRFYGYGEQELVGRHFTLVVPEAQKAQLASLHDAFIAGNSEIRGEWDVVTRSGEVKAVLADAARIRDVSGRPKKVTFVMDITREKEFQRKLEEQNRRLEEMSRTDSLTKVANRRHLFELLETERERATRYQHPLSIIIMDIDHFKTVNDTYGHNAGDDVLVKVAQVASSLIRSMDSIGRYGGEEFLAVLPETDLAGAFALAERMRQAIESLSYPHPGLKTTASFGVATYSGEDALVFVDIADKRLYTAKQSGRNCVVAVS